VGTVQQEGEPRKGATPKRDSLVKARVPEAEDDSETFYLVPFNIASKDTGVKPVLDSGKGKLVGWEGSRLQDRSKIPKLGDVPSSGRESDFNLNIR
jgi:hypothetical protein